MAESVHPQAGSGPDAGEVYALGSSHGESARLQRQTDELAADSAALLDWVGLGPGQSAIDLGCGPRGIVDLLAGRVSPGGRVVGLDSDAAHTAMAAEFAASQGLGDVEIMTADASRTGLRSGSEPDTDYGMCYPPQPGSRGPARSSSWSSDAMAPTRRSAAGCRSCSAGQDWPMSGPMPGVQMYPPGNSRRTIRLDLVRSMRPQVLEMGLASEAELDQLDAAARAHLDDPRTIAVSGLLFLTWGRKPATAGDVPEHRR